MRVRWAAVLLGMICVAGALAAPTSAQVREQRPNLIGGEVGGRGIALTLNYERFFTNNLGIGAGVMALGVNDGFVGIIPIYGSVVLGDVHALYLGAGTSVFLGAGSIDDDFESEAVASLAVGYQFQSMGGFFVRPLFTGLFEGGSYLIWPGITIGGSF